MTTLSKINSSTQKRAKILLAPLDWGLGHATRCIPIVKELLSLGCEVIIAATGGQKALLEGEFPFLTYVELPGYGVKYGKNRAFTLLKIVAKIPKILIRIKAEKAWLEAFVQRERPDAVISDNRYGLYNDGIFSVFITHQLCIRTPFGKGADRILQRIQYQLLNRFSVCWVPDLEKKDSLAGELSHPEKLPSIPVRYIGILSRFGKKEKVEERCDLLVLLSGPEPQRTIFEKIILAQLGACPGKVILVRGLPGRKEGEGREGAGNGGAPSGSPGLIIHDHLAAGALNAVASGAELVLSRPGYSSVMDLLTLGKKCVFVPTPGQTEQEYLGSYLAGRHLALCVPQSGFSLSRAMAAAGIFPFAEPCLEGNGLLREVIGEWVSSLRDSGEQPLRD